MIHLLYIAALVAAGLAIPPPPVCERQSEWSVWSTWSDCTQPKLCPVPDDDESSQEVALTKRNRWDCVTPFSMPDSEGYIPCVDGMAGEWPCNDIDLLSFVNIRDLGEPNPLALGNDMWGWIDEEYGEEYAIVCLSSGASFVRVTDPLNPVVLGILYAHSNQSWWRDVKVYNNHAFIISEALDHGMQVFDLTQLRGKEDFSELEETAHYDGVGMGHNIAINEESGYAYLVGCKQFSEYDVCQGGLHIVDVNEPTNPQFTACFGGLTGDGYIHDAQCVNYHGPDSRYQGREVCFTYTIDSMTLMDVTDHYNPTLISKTTYDNAEWCHQGWLTEDHTIVLSDDEYDEYYGITETSTTYIWDVTDLENPELRNTYSGTEPTVDHNQYIIGNLVYQSNLESGLRILYLDQENYELEEVAYFDTTPHRHGLDFYGLWSNYAWYKDGMVASNEQEYGLFLHMPNYDAINAKIAARKARQEASRP